MEKRYQAFISSTYHDLQGARREVSMALLRANCFPAGMELFPAADAEQFEFIKTVIDQSDYYIVISAGRYGSIHSETGLSYTEMEYDYAVGIGKPIIRLLHTDPFKELKGEFIEENDNGRKKLRVFREKMISGSLVKFWSSPSELMAETVFALQDAQRRRPAVGWVRADGIASSEARIQIAELKQRVAELELEASYSTINFEEVLDALEGEVDYLVEEYSDHFDPQPTGKKATGKLKRSDIAKQICISLLEVRTTWEVESRLSDHLISLEGYSYYDRASFEGDFATKKLLRWLEGASVVTSQPYTDFSGGARSSEQHWFLTEEARRWISRFVTTDGSD